MVDLSRMNLNPPADADDLDQAAAALGGSAPADYSAFLASHNGGEGFVGENYIVLWKAEELAEFNDDFGVAAYAPGLILFGSDGGGESLGFDTRDPNRHVVMMPFIGGEWSVGVPVGSTFTAFLEKLETSPSLFAR